MTIAADFTYEAPDALEGVLRSLAEGDGRAAVLAGGTDLVAWMRDDLAAPEKVIDLKRVPGLDRLELAGNTLHVGCLVTFTDLIESEIVGDRLPLVAEMARWVASVGIRNRATLVGNICSAVPSCDAGPVLLVLDTEIHVAGPAGSRIVPIGEWFLGPRRTALSVGEVVTHLRIPLPPGTHGGAFARLTRYRGEDLAQASVAVLAASDHRRRVAFGAVAPTPLRSSRIEAVLEGRELDEATIEEVRRLVPEEITPISDVRASDRYRLAMCQVMVGRALRAADERAAGGGPPYGTRLI